MEPSIRSHQQQPSLEQSKVEIALKMPQDIFPNRPSGDQSRQQTDRPQKNRPSVKKKDLNRSPSRTNGLSLETSNDYGLK